MVTVLVVALVFSGITAIIVGPFYIYFHFRTRERESLQSTLRMAHENGQTLTPELIETLNKRVRIERAPDPIRDIRGGIIWLALAGGLVACGYLASWDYDEPFYVLKAIAAVPAVIGGVLLVLGLVGLARGRRKSA